MNKPILVLLSALLLPLLSSLTNAAEEQIFIDDLTLPQLRSQIDKIQKEIYKVFNASGEDDQFKIVCHDYSPTCSLIKRGMRAAIYYQHKNREFEKCSQRS